MEQQGEALAQLTNQSAELLSGDVCNKHGPAAELREQVCDLGWNGGMTEWVFWSGEMTEWVYWNERMGMKVSVLQVSELEDMWAGEEQLLRHSLSDVEEKVTSLFLISSPYLLSSLTHSLSLSPVRRLSGRDRLCQVFVNYLSSLSTSPVKMRLS